MTGTTVDEDGREIDGTAPSDARADRVRIIGAERAGGPGEAAEGVANVEPADEAAEGSFGPEDWEAGPDISLPHWTEAPTGEVPAVLARHGDDDDPWAQVPEPSWREERADWAQDDPFAPSMYAESDAPIRPLGGGADLDERQPWAFELGQADEEPGAGGSAGEDELDDAASPTDAPGWGQAWPPLEEPEAVAFFRPDDIAGEATQQIIMVPPPVPDEHEALVDDLEAAGGRRTWRMGRRGFAGLAGRRRSRGGLHEADRRADPGVGSLGGVDEDHGGYGEDPVTDDPGAFAPAGQQTVHATEALSATDEVPAVRREWDADEPAAASGAGIGAAWQERPDEAEPPDREEAEPVPSAPGHVRAGQRVGRAMPSISSGAGALHRHDGPGPGDRLRPPDRVPANGPRAGGRGVGAAIPRRDQGAAMEQTAPSRAGRNMPAAILSGVAVGIVTLVFFHFGSVPAMVVVTAVVTLAAMEAFAAFRRGGYHPATLLGLVAVVALLVATYNKGQRALPLVLVLLVAFTLLWHLAGVDRRADPVRSTAATLLVFCWIGVFGSFAALLLAPSLFPDRHGIAYLLGALIAAVAYDVGALAAGAWFGRHPLSAVSPHKTWEGLVGGTIASLVFAVAVVPLIHPWTLGKAAVLGLVVAIVSPIGDLGESLVKRHLGLKDMGRVLPGHGGILDRVDGLLFVLPATFYLLRAFHLG